ncbi:uncharacterized protein [Nicotiana tomentosiformis]|uniref:uncharacterized protein n=1 Tax=Nicotiana tomentosiformis TaxID=4098 RepID=UPI00388C8134
MERRCGCYCFRPYAIASDAVITGIASNGVITGIVSVCHKDASVLFDPGSTYSYVSSYFAHFLDLPREPLVSFVHVSTHVGDTIVVDCVYRSCVVTIGGLEIQVDLLLLSMAHFDVILGMDWLSPCHVVLDCHAKTVMLAMPGFLRVEWSGSVDCVPSMVILYLKSQRMVEKGFLSYLAFVIDVGAETPTIDSIPVVRDFSDVFPADPLGMPSDRDIDFGIDLVPGGACSAYADCIIEIERGEALHKFSKCEFWLSAIAFLGHVVSSEGIQVDLKKIEAVQS